MNFLSLEDKTVGEPGVINLIVECEEFGAIGNVPANSINRFPVIISGLIDVYNPDAVVNGYDAETDRELKDRYYEKFQKPAKAGNKYHYEQWAKEVVGVGGVRVIPRWKADETMAIVRDILDTILLNGSYTDMEVQNIINKAIENALSLKVVIIDSNGQPAGQELIRDVIDHIESERPFGAYPTVASATPIEINILVNLVLAEGYTGESVKASISNNITKYLANLAFKTTYISYAQIGNIIIETEGVLDYSDLKVNNGIANISVASEEVAIVGGVS